MKLVLERINYLVLIKADLDIIRIDIGKMVTNLAKIYKFLKIPSQDEEEGTNEEEEEDNEEEEEAENEEDKEDVEDEEKKEILMI